jgi:hypothetical protein
MKKIFPVINKIAFKIKYIIIFIIKIFLFGLLCVNMFS